jgi:hypothetical protein
MNTHRPARAILFLFLLPAILNGQAQRDIPLKSWPAPLYWHPSVPESQMFIARKSEGPDNGAAATGPANALVFVAMTPCRVVDTRQTQGFSAPFGPPSLVGGQVRVFPIQSNATCSIPVIAQAYSFNITVAPPGFLNYLTVWPEGQPRPNASTLNSYVGTVIANAAIVPGGTAGAIDVYASEATDLIIDINGYYAPQSGITLAQGAAGTPSLSFAGDSGTGIYSSGAGSLNIATGGMNRLQLANGNAILTGNLSVTGNGVIGGTLGIGTTAPQVKVDIFENKASKPALWATNTGSDAYGVVGQGTTGVQGTGSSVGVRGVSDAQGIGVKGESTQGFAVAGYTSGGTAIYGRSFDAAGHAGYFDGAVHVAGLLTKNSGSFKIDHPLDPANKYLYHSFVESPDMMNIYNGNAVLDENGEAWIHLPEWFEALNRDFRYQLTSIGAFSPLFVAEEIQRNRVKIGGGKAGGRVSWQVTGIRHDAYAEAHRIPVEESKTDNEVGRYQFPELYGEPKEKAIGYQ